MGCSSCGGKRRKLYRQPQTETKSIIETIPVIPAGSQVSSDSLKQSESNSVDSLPDSKTVSKNQRNYQQLLRQRSRVVVKNKQTNE